MNAKEKLELLQLAELLRAINDKERDQSVYLILIVILMALNILVSIAWIALYKLG
jgi:hypothetical protein